MGTSPVIKVLVDSNVYFRVGREFYPLFGGTFGHGPSYQLVIHSGTNFEYYNNSRLRSKFSWMSDEVYSDDRATGRLRIGEAKKRAVNETIDFLQDTVAEMMLTCSRFDCQCLATAMEMGLQFATDDIDLQKLCQQYEFPFLTSIDVLGLFLTTGKASMDQVRACVELWDYFGDGRARFAVEYEHKFGEPLPRHE